MIKCGGIIVFVGEHIERVNCLQTSSTLKWKSTGEFLFNFLHPKPHLKANEYFGLLRLYKTTC